MQCNRAFTEMFGYCISEASGMQPDTLLNIPEFPADNRIRLQQLLWKTARDQDEFLLLTRTGVMLYPLAPAAAAFSASFASRASRVDAPFFVAAGNGENIDIADDDLPF